MHTIANALSVVSGIDTEDERNDCAANIRPVHVCYTEPLV